MNVKMRTKTKKELKSKVWLLTMAIIILKKMLGLSAMGSKGHSMVGVANEVLLQKHLYHQS